MEYEVIDTAPAAAPRLSIVVLPFINLGDDREQQYFADGITEDLTTDLSRLSLMSVTSRNTAFTYRNRSADTKQIGRELGVRYVLEGSVQRSGNRVRVSAQLIDAETDTHLWADRLDSDAGDLFALQNEITSRIAIALHLELVEAEAARPTVQPDAWTTFSVHGRYIWERYRRVTITRSKSRSTSTHWRWIPIRRRHRAIWPRSWQRACSNK